MIINGEYVDASNGKVFRQCEAVYGQVICTVPSGTREDFERAAVVAKKAQKEWAEVPLYKRVDIIRKFTSIVRENLEDIARTVCEEGGKTITDARGEVECLCMVFESFAEAARHFCGNTYPLNAEARTQGDIIFTVREPLGVFVAITPFNFPMELYAHKVAPAIVTGNAVIIKARVRHSVGRSQSYRVPA